MKNKINTIIPLFLLLFMSGCAIDKQVVGEFYLQQKKYDVGLEHFESKLKEDNSSAYSHYYYGRFLLAKDIKKRALKHLKQAVKLDPFNADYHCWLGVAYSSFQQLKNERKQYQEALKVDPKHLQSLTYLAHNFYDSKAFTKALEYYTKVIKISPKSQMPLYNRAMALYKLNRKPEAILAFKEYLSYYPFGVLARKAVIKLNKLGNIDYNNHLIGFRTVTLKNISFVPFSSKIDYSSKSSLNLLGEILNINQKIEIHIISYQLNNKLLAKQKAASIKKYIMKKYPDITSNRLKLSWFNRSKKIVIGKKKYVMDEYIDFITVAKSSKL